MNCMNATIFTPKDDTLHARIDAWRQVRDAYKQLNENMSIKESTFQESLGSRADIHFAKETINHSYTQASQSISKQELEHALSSKLLSKNEVTELVTAQRIAQSRERSKQLSRSNSLSRKR